MEERERWETFRRVVMAAPKLRQKLLEPLEREPCIEAMLQVSRSLGLHLTRSDIEAAEQSFHSAADTTPIVDTAEAARFLNGWLPSGALQVGGEPYIDWFDPGDRGLKEPFFGESVHRARFHPFYLWFSVRTPFEALLPVTQRDPGVPPTGFLFHLSRCGSTLVAQMLAALERHIVLSEPEPLDWALRLPSFQPGLTEAQQTLWLRAMLSALGNRRDRSADRLFVKFDAWHTPLLPHIHQAFPEVPWAFLYRDPVEVLVSHVREPGYHMMDQPQFRRLFGMDGEGPLPMETYREQALTAICRAALEHSRQHTGLFLNYTSLPEAVFQALADHFGLRFTAEEIAQMQAVTGVHAKRPYLPFEADSASKQARGQTAISPERRARLAALYQECEEAASAARQETL